MERKSKSSSRAAALRADKWLGGQYPNLNGRHIEEAFREGLVLSSTGAKVKKGDRIGPEGLDCLALEKHLKTLREGNPKLVVRILAENESWLAVDKPPGMPSHPISLFDRDTVTHWALAKYPSIGREFPQVQPTISPHRLDTDTSGILIVAKTKLAYDDWRRGFESKLIEKSYLAWCWGDPEKDVYATELPIAHAPGKQSKMVVVEGTRRVSPPVMPASTTMDVISRRKNGVFLAKIHCKTGVTHQVRVHLAFLGFPLVGDKKYDPLWEKRSIQESRHWLRASELKYRDLVISSDRTEFESKTW